MDFLGISDHNHYSGNNSPGMHVADYARGIYQADTANRDGSFVCMYGFEYGVISNGGHVVTYGVPGLVGWETGSGLWGTSNNYDIFCTKSDYPAFWPIVNTYSNAFCTLAHPQTGDYSDIAGAAIYSAVADDAIAGVAIRSGAAMSTKTDYSDPAPTGYESYYLKLLARGYHLGPTADQDNHYTTFGRNNQIRTVVLAGALKRDSIMAAYRAMRFYASDDWNAQVTFTVNGSYMGSNFTTTNNSSIYVSVSDADAGDNVSKIEIYYGIPGSGTNASILTSNLSSATLNFQHTTSATETFYYFAKITQVDGDIIWTSPVWILRDVLALPLEITRFTGTIRNNQAALNWTLAQETGIDRYEIERSVDGIHYAYLGTKTSTLHNSSLPVNYDYVDACPQNGTNFYRLKIWNQDGHFNYSGIVTLSFSKPLISDIRINPNPVNNILNLVCFNREASPVTCIMYNHDGRMVKSWTGNFSAGTNSLTMDVSTLSAGSYFIVMSRPNERIGEASFIKQ